MAIGDDRRARRPPFAKMTFVDALQYACSRYGRESSSMSRVTCGPSGQARDADRVSSRVILTRATAMSVFALGASTITARRVARVKRMVGAFERGPSGVAESP